MILFILLALLGCREEESLIIKESSRRDHNKPSSNGSNTNDPIEPANLLNGIVNSNAANKTPDDNSTVNVPTQKIVEDFNKEDIQRVIDELDWETLTAVFECKDLYLKTLLKGCEWDEFAKNYSNKPESGDKLMDLFVKYKIVSIEKKDRYDNYNLAEQLITKGLEYDQYSLIKFALTNCQFFQNQMPIFGSPNRNAWKQLVTSKSTFVAWDVLGRAIKDGKTKIVESVLNDLVDASLNESGVMRDIIKEKGYDMFGPVAVGGVAKSILLVMNYIKQYNIDEFNEWGSRLAIAVCKQKNEIGSVEILQGLSDLGLVPCNITVGYLAGLSKQRGLLAAGLKMLQWENIKRDSMAIDAIFFAIIQYDNISEIVGVIPKIMDVTNEDGYLIHYAAQRDLPALRKVADYDSSQLMKTTTVTYEQEKRNVIVEDCTPLHWLFIMHTEQFNEANKEMVEYILGKLSDDNIKDLKSDNRWSQLFSRHDNEGVKLLRAAFDRVK